MSGFRLGKLPELPEPKRLIAQVTGTTLTWSPEFRAAMSDLTRGRGLPAGVPGCVKSAVVESQGLLLLWPCAPDDPDGFPVHVSPRERRVVVDLPEAFDRLGIQLPFGVAIGVPAQPFQSPKYGPCLALQFNQAEFWYRKSRSSAIALLPGTMLTDDLALD